MANEKRLIPRGDKVTLDELPCGTLFAFSDDCIAVKSEYRCNNGLIEAFIIDSGEQFWGGAKTAKEQNELMVQPLDVVDVDAVPVVRCKDCKYWNKDAMACDTLPWVDSVEHANWYADDFCAYGERKDDD